MTLEKYEKKLKKIRKIFFQFFSISRSVGYESFFRFGLISRVLAILLTGSLLWFLTIQIMRLSIKFLLSYRGWMYQSEHDKNITKTTKLWFVSLLYQCCFVYNLKWYRHFFIGFHDSSRCYILFKELCHICHFLRWMIL